MGGELLLLLDNYSLVVGDADDIGFASGQFLLVERALAHQHSDFGRFALLHLNYIVYTTYHL